MCGRHLYPVKHPPAPVLTDKSITYMYLNNVYVSQSIYILLNIPVSTDKDNKMKNVIHTWKILGQKTSFFIDREEEFMFWDNLLCCYKQQDIAHC